MATAKTPATKGPATTKDKNPKKGSTSSVEGGNQAALPAGYKPRMQSMYREQVIPAMMKKFGYKSVMECPRLVKICLNQGVKGSTSDKKMIDDAVAEMTIISGQRAIPTMSKKDISNFKLRKNMPIGCRVTLRHVKMYEFLDRFIAVSLPRVRDFKGISEKSFDGRGNYTMGINEQIIYPEINIDKITRLSGMDITFVTTAKTNEEAYELLKEMGMPFTNMEKTGK
jgi:large subunit ribosomal protein L5